MLTLTTPKNHLHAKEQQTIEIVKALKDKGFTEGSYEKPFRQFTNGAHTVKINIMGAVVDHNGTIFRGNAYGASIHYLQNLKID